MSNSHTHRQTDPISDPKSIEHPPIQLDEHGALLPVEDLPALQRALERRLEERAEVRGQSKLDMAEERGLESATAHGARCVAEGVDALASAVRRDHAAAIGKKGV
ncbi:MAG: hypothetical protein AAF909_04100, partial [Pseudomonadota bacterium]